MKKLRNMILTACMVFSLITPVRINAEENYDVNITKMEVTPYVKKAKDAGNELRNDVVATIVNDKEAFDGWAKIYVGENKPYILKLDTQIVSGNNTITIPITDTNEMLKPLETTTLKVEIYDSEDCTKDHLRTVYENKEWQRTRHWEFYLCQTMHTDLGYTLYQEQLKDLFSGFLDTVKQYMKNSDEREEDIEKYMYAIESGFVMGEGYMSRRNADDIQELLDLMKKGRMNIGAGRFNYVMEAFTPEETARAAYYTNRYLKDSLGIEPSKLIRMFDNPAFSKSFVDIASQAGIKYGIHSQNPDRSPYHEKREYDVFYLQGNEPENKLLIFNGKSYGENYGFGGTHWNTEGSPELAESEILKLISHLESRTGERGTSLSPYPYDKFPLLLIPYGDNKQPMEEPIQNANAVNKKWADQGYVYPHIESEFPEKFFEEMEKEYGDIIPVETGTEENWWNDGWGTTAYESGVNKEAGNRVSVAETTSGLNSLVNGEKYPVEDINEAVERNITYDEHTWGASSYDGSENYHQQFEWKRSNAFGAKALSDKLVNNAVNGLAKQVNVNGDSVYVYNFLNWTRDDVVTIKDEGFPENFVLKDGETMVPYTREDGKLKFVAADVPALGYKTFQIEKTDKPAVSISKTKVVGNTVENDFYKITFADDGTISSIIDKKNGNREVVDQDAEVGFNQYNYYDDFGVPFSNMGFPIHDNESAWKKYTPNAASSNLVLEENELGATVTLDTSTFRASSITQKVTLYDDLPRIDIENVVEKESLGSLDKKEEAFYTFPFNASDDYKITYDLPIGNQREGEQVYGTSHDWYTASKWVNVKDGDYSMSIALPNTSLLQFGERRTGAWSFDYVSEKPHIYSYVMNNMWQTNFQGDQPGKVSFKYSIMTGKENNFDKTSHFGWEISNPLESARIDGPQFGAQTRTADSYMEIDQDNVQVTTLKSAESNGEGMILRLTEIEGKDTKVTVKVPFDKVKSINETDIIENDKEGTEQKGNSYTITIPAYGTRTLRLNFDGNIEKVTNVNAASSAKGQYGENLSLKAAAKADSEYRDGGYPAENALEIDSSKTWATNETKTGTLTLHWNSPITVSTILIQDRPGMLDWLDSATLIMKLNGKETYKESIDDFKDDQLKTLTLANSVQLDELVLEVKGSANVGIDGIELYEDKFDSATSLQGTKLTWDEVDGAWYYEVFRSNGKDDRYLGYAQGTSYFDTQVTGDVETEYTYKVRAVGKGVKGAFSDRVKVQKIGFKDAEAPEKPILHADVRNSSRVDLYWNPCKDDTQVSYYEIYRDGDLIGTTRDAYIVSYRDYSAKENMDYVYKVAAIDKSGKQTYSDELNVSTKVENNIKLKDIVISSGTLSPQFDPNIKSYQLHLGDHFNRLKPVTITAFTQNEKDVLTINGKAAENGKAFTVENLKADDYITVKVKGDEGFKVYVITVDSKDPIISAKSAKAGSTFSSSQDAVNLINNSGMSGTDSLKDTTNNHSSAVGMWHSDANPGENAWIEVDLGQSYPLDEMWIWNLNQGTGEDLNRGLKNVKIEYKLNEEDKWTVLEAPEGMTFTDGNPEFPYQFAKASGSETQAATNLNDGKNTPVSFNGVKARYVKITAAPNNGDGSWGGEYFGLSELRFTSTVDLISPIGPEEINISVKDGGESVISTDKGTLTFEAQILPENANERDFSWSVTDKDGNKTDVAAISSDGVLQARKNGTVLVVATSKFNEVKGIKEVTITGQSTVIKNVAAVADNTFEGAESNQNATNLVNDSGMSGSDSVADLHDNNTNAVTMWHTESTPKDKAVVTFDLGSVQKVADMWIWNMNQSGNADRGLKNVKIEYRNSEDEEWKELENVHPRENVVEGYPFQLAKASGKPDQPATNLVGGEPIAINKEVRYIRLSANPEIGVGSYGSEYFGLSEVRFTTLKEADEALLNLINDAKALDENDYTADSWLEFEKALNQATDVLNTAYASDEEVTLAAAELENAKNNLKEKQPEADKTALKELINNVSTIEKGNYTDESWEVFQKALTEAQAILDKADASQEEVNTAYDALDAAVKGLTEKPADKTALQALYDELKTKEKGNYTDESWEVFQNALEKANIVLGNPKATQEEINGAMEELNKANNALEEKPEEIEADKSDLQALYEEYSKIDQSVYTEESLAKFNKAMEEAKKVLEDKHVTQKEVDLTLGMLQEAYDGLVKKPTDPQEPTDPEDPSEPIKPIEPENPIKPIGPSNPVKPNNPEEPDKPSDKEKNEDEVKTGEESSIGLMLGLLMLSGAGIACMISRKKEEK